MLYIKILRNYLTMHRFSHGKSSTRSKPEKEVRKLINIIQSAHPDILGVCEIGQDKDLKDLQSRLKKAGISLPYIHRTHGDDPVRSLAILSRFPITSTAKPTSSHYTINGKPFQISRGILDVTIQLPNKKIRFLGVHLKSKRPVEEADQAIMRRYESILFRKHIDTILTQTPNALLLAYGDFNDTKHSKAVYTIKGRSHTRNQMEMLNLTDSRGETWTHYWKREDTYSRFDYVFTSKQLTPFIDKRNALPGNVCKVRALRAVLADEAIDVLIRSALRGRVRMYKIGYHFPVAGILLWIGELLSDVNSYGQRLEAIRL